MHYTGTCQVCGARLRIFSGKVAIHNLNTAKCEGSNKPPFEHENTRAKIALANTNSEHYAKWQRERLKNWQLKPLTPEA